MNDAPTSTVTHLPVSGPKSIQAEQQEDAVPQVMDQGEVDAYVDSQSPEVVACRERGFHLFDTVTKLGQETPTTSIFVGVTPEGLLVREKRCTCCGLAYRREFWEAHTVMQGRKRVTRWREIPGAAYTTYKDGPNGESYLAPRGHGRMFRRQVRESVVSKALSGLTVKKVTDEARAAEKAAREARTAEILARVEADAEPEQHSGEAS